VVTAHDLIAEVERRGARFGIVGETLKASPRSALDDDLRRLIGEHKSAIVSELRDRSQRAASLIEEARNGGLEISLDGSGLRVRQRTNANPNEALIARLAEHKAAVIAELQQQDVLAYGAERGLYEAEWLVAGCSAFTALERADEAAEARYGACLSCGGSIELHGSPDASKWRRVASLDDVEIAAVRYVLASAGAIARDARR
jgi:hypothetical protein